MLRSVRYTLTPVSVDDLPMDRLKSAKRVAAFSESVEGHLCCDHVHMMIRIPPQHSVSHVIGYMKGKSALRVARDFMGRHRSFKGYHFWDRGYFVSTVAIDEKLRSGNTFGRKRRPTETMAKKDCFRTE